MSGFPYLWPPQASAYSAEVDRLGIGFTLLVVALSAPVFALTIAFAIRYRRGKPANRRHPVNRNVWLETSWAIVPFCLILYFFVWSTGLFVDLRSPPADALDIAVVAKQWMWKFEHPGGQREIDELHVPAGQDVKLTMASQDVIHSLFLPALRLKQDAVPGRYTTLWFNADRPGVYQLACAEFCGADHSEMVGRFVVMDPADYARWLDMSDVDGSSAAQGAALFRAHGCGGCHGEGSSVRAPPLEGLYGRMIPLSDGSVVRADEQYIRDSILLPQKQVAAGYEPVMPTFRNVLDEDDLFRVVAYLKSLGSREATP
jgi:cytochrome c oxidase subunit 2